MNKKFPKGVTLMETIVSLGILTFGIVSALSLMLSSINFSRNTEQMVVVVNLAREGIEIARSLRSSDGFSSLVGGNKIIGANYISGDLEIGIANNSDIEDCSNCDLKIYNSRYFHNLPAETGEETIFKRMIIVSDENPYEKKVISKVYWNEHGNSHTFELEVHFTDWE
jgi:type II secretory pathway pseudopilin PulG